MELRSDSKGQPSNLEQNSHWGIRSLTFWLIMLCSFGLIALGVNGLIQPLAASRAFGLEIVDPLDSGFVRVKATRDLAFGLGIAALLFLKMKKGLIVLGLVGVLIPLIDGILVLTQSGGQVQDSWQHFITMGFVLFVVVLMWKEENGKADDGFK